MGNVRVVILHSEHFLREDISACGLFHVVFFSQWHLCLREYPIKNYRRLSPNYRGKRWAYVLFIRGAANPPVIYLCAHLRFTPRSLQVCLFAHFNK